MLRTPNRSRKPTKRIAFTERRLRNLRRPASGSEYVFDTEEQGLCVRLTPGNAAFVFYRWHKGQPKRITIADVGEVPLRQVRAITAGYRGDLARGLDVFAAARSKRDALKPPTLGDAYQRLVSRPDMRPSTLRDYASLWLLVPIRMKSRGLDDICESDLRKLHTEVGARHPRTANKLLSLFSVLIRRNGRRHDNPASNIERFREEARQRVLTTDELQRLRVALAACRIRVPESRLSLARIGACRSLCRSIVSKPFFCRLT